MKKHQILTLNILKQHGSFTERKEEIKKNEQFSKETISTPDERIALEYNEINDKLANELLSKIRSMDWRLVEKLCIQILLAMGYGGFERGETTQRTRDEGIDGIINEDKLGLHKIYIQVKRYKDSSKISNNDILSFIGAIANKGGTKGVFITTSEFSQDAITIGLKNPNIVLIDGLHLSSLMIENNIGISIEKSYHLKKIDSDFFEFE